VFFTDQQKAIYTDLRGGLFDPLRCLHLLTIHTDNQLTELVRLRNPDCVDSGDVSKSGRATAHVTAARAELELADAGRKVFGYPEFPDMTDAEVLENLFYFCDYLEGKGSQAPTPRTSEVCTPAVSSPTHTTSS